ncbi:hypothetical protein [Haemophilus influenzae]|uniref:hypothetical protein n=1 Tax=Haemophilus influenzae TaxID=727 RepID=UPI001EFE7945|nr:hypothetical protein [Haemophilus influenzae]
MKPFTTSLLGSMPRSQALLMARKKHILGKITTAELKQIVVQETKQIVELQQRTGIDIITSGELLRDNYLSPEQIWLNPDFGFATFSNRPLNGFDIIEAKFKVLNEAKSILRERYV